MNAIKLISNEVENYLNESTDIGGIKFSQKKLVDSIILISNGVHKGGYYDSQGQYRYFFDICSYRVDSEVKNIDFDTSNINIYSENREDSGIMYVLNLANKEYMRETGQATEINDAIEEGSGWGNVVWKKVKGGYERADLKNFYVINQTAKTLMDSPVIERHVLSQSQLRAKSDVWNNIDEVIEYCGIKGMSATGERTADDKEIPYYEIYERNGEVSEKDLFEAQGKEGGDENKFLLARIIATGISSEMGSGKEYILFADELSGKMSDYYKEYHRGRYNGRWFRKGIYETLFDIQSRANEIGNHIKRGLDWASKVIFRSNDNLLANNILTQLANGDVIKSSDLQQVDVRMQGLDQLIADWNRLMTEADKLCNSYEVVSGESMPSGTPFRMGAMLNQNANKLFDFLREKLAIALSEVYNDWILPKLIKELNSKTIIRLTGGGETMRKYFETMVNGWYNRNLLTMPPHTEEEAKFLKQKKMEELKSRPEQFLETTKGWLDGVKARAIVIITGEQLNMQERLETIANLIQFETDPIRRDILLNRIYSLKGIEELPPSQPPQQPQQPQEEKLKVGQPINNINK